MKFVLRAVICVAILASMPVGAVDLKQLGAIAANPAIPMFDRLSAAVQYEVERRRIYREQYTPGLEIPAVPFQEMVSEGLSETAGEESHAQTLAVLVSEPCQVIFGPPSEEVFKRVRSLLTSKSESIQNILLASPEVFRLSEPASAAAAYELASQRVWNHHFAPDADWFSGRNTDIGAMHALSYLIINSSHDTLSRFIRETSQSEGRINAFQRAMNVCWGNMLSLVHIHAIVTGFTQGYRENPEQRKLILETLGKFWGRFVNNGHRFYDRVFYELSSHVADFLTDIVLDPESKQELRDAIRDDFWLRRLALSDSIFTKLPLDEYGVEYARLMLVDTDNRGAFEVLSRLLSSDRVSEYKTLATLFSNPKVAYNFIAIGRDIKFDGPALANALSEKVGRYFHAVMGSEHFSIHSQEDKDAIWPFVRMLGHLNAKKDFHLEVLRLFRKAFPSWVAEHEGEIRSFPARARRVLFPAKQWVAATCGELLDKARVKMAERHMRKLYGR